MSHNILAHDIGSLVAEAWHRHESFEVFGGESLTVEQALRPFHFEWIKTPVLAQLPDGSTVEVPGKSSIVRSDINLPVSVMSDKYGLNQYSTGFEAIASALDKAGFNIVTSGTLGNGAKGFLSARVPDGEWEVAGYSLIKSVVNFGDSVDGSSAFRGVNTTDVVVCGNTFAAYLLGVPAIFSIRHTANSEAVIDETLRELEHSLTVTAEIRSAVERLTNEAHTEAEFRALLAHNNMLGDKPDHTKSAKAQTQYDNTFAEIMARYHADDVKPIVGTKMHTLMALQGYEQHVRRINKSNGVVPSRVGRTLDKVIFNAGPAGLDMRASVLMGVTTSKLIKA